MFWSCVVSCIDSISLVYSPPFDLRKFYLFECNLYLAVYIFFFHAVFKSISFTFSSFTVHRRASMVNGMVCEVANGICFSVLFLAKCQHTFSLRRNYHFVLDFFSFLSSLGHSPKLSIGAGTLNCCTMKCKNFVLIFVSLFSATSFLVDGILSLIHEKAQFNEHGFHICAWTWPMWRMDAKDRG